MNPGFPGSVGIALSFVPGRYESPLARGAGWHLALEDGAITSLRLCAYGKSPIHHEEARLHFQGCIRIIAGRLGVAEFCLGVQRLSSNAPTCCPSSLTC